MPLNKIIIFDSEIVKCSWDFRICNKFSYDTHKVFNNISTCTAYLMYIAYL